MFSMLSTDILINDFYRKYDWQMFLRIFLHMFNKKYQFNLNCNRYVLFGSHVLKSVTLDRKDIKSTEQVHAKTDLLL